MLTGEAKSEPSKPELNLREGPLSLLTVEGIDHEKVLVYLRYLVNMTLKALGHTTRSPPYRLSCHRITNTERNEAGQRTESTEDKHSQFTSPAQ